MSTVWAFDLGKGSIGEAVWDEEKKQFVHVASLLIPAEFASTKDAASRRRMMRTRQAHKAREAWLDEVWQAAGQESLFGRRVGKVDGKWQLVSKGDERLEREFAKKGDPTCYTSCLLRIKLLRGEKLEPWQIYKAMHSAIQKRGYGRVPWAGRDVKAKKDATPEEIATAQKKADDDLAKKDPTYRAAIEAWPAFKKAHPKPEHHFPCYYDAEKQGLWDEARPDELKSAVNHLAGSTRQVRFDREDVDNEIVELGRQASLQLEGALESAFAKWKQVGWEVVTPKSKQKKTFRVRAENAGEFIAFGPAGRLSQEAQSDFTKYLTFRQKAGVHPGSKDDWMGATGQKTPRFDNRIVNDCAIMEGMQVCKVDARMDAKTGKPYPDSMLACEVTFLMKLKNLRVEDGDKQRPLTLAEIQILFDWAKAKATAVKPDAKNWGEKIIKCFAVTGANWGKDREIKKLELHPVVGHEEVKSPKVEGRSRYSRPALKVIRVLLLGGQRPSVFLARFGAREEALLNEIGMDVFDVEPVKAINGQKQRSLLSRPYLLTKHLKFLRDLAQTNNTWEGIYIPEQRMDALEARHRDEDGSIDSSAAIRELIGSINDPIVRHRLQVFAERLAELENEHGIPAEIVLEFVRTDFMGEQAKKDLAKFQKEREKTRMEARERMSEQGIEDRSAPIKYELLKQQGDTCLYCGNLIAIDELDQCEVDHIVPRGQKHKGPDAMVNYVLAHRTCNDAKGERTPFEWKHGKEGWDGYMNTVNLHATSLRNKKVQLLLREDAPQLVERYTALAETAWISKLAQKIISLHFGWRGGIDDDRIRRITVVSGGLTGRIRRKYKLNSILNPNAETEEEAEKKNRKDDRHHALDAMVISFLPGWMRDPKKEKFFRFPDPVGRNPHGFFLAEIDRVMPEVIAYEKPVLAETAYGDREDGEVIVQRTLLVSLAMKPAAQGKADYDLDYLRKQVKGVRDSVISKKLASIAASNPTQSEWEEFCKDYRKPKKDGDPGPLVKKVTVRAGETTEYREMSKDETGAWRKGFGSHKGQIIYLGVDEVVGVQPVYVHSSVASELKKLKETGAQVLGFFQSRCMVKTIRPIDPADYSMVIRNEQDKKQRVAAEVPLPPSKLTLRNIVTASMMAEMTLADNTRIVAKVDVWVKAGLARL